MKTLHRIINVGVVSLMIATCGNGDNVNSQLYDPNKDANFELRLSSLNDDISKFVECKSNINDKRIRESIMYLLKYERYGSYILWTRGNDKSQYYELYYMLMNIYKFLYNEYEECLKIYKSQNNVEQLSMEMAIANLYEEEVMNPDNIKKAKSMLTNTLVNRLFNGLNYTDKDHQAYGILLLMLSHYYNIKVSDFLKYLDKNTQNYYLHKDVFFIENQYDITIASFYKDYFFKKELDRAIGNVKYIKHENFEKLDPDAILTDAIDQVLITNYCKLNISNEPYDTCSENQKQKHLCGTHLVYNVIKKLSEQKEQGEGYMDNAVKVITLYILCNNKEEKNIRCTDAIRKIFQCFKVEEIDFLIDLMKKNIKVIDNKMILSLTGKSLEANTVVNEIILGLTNFRDHYAKR